MSAVPPDNENRNGQSSSKPVHLHEVLLYQPDFDSFLNSINGTVEEMVLSGLPPYVSVRGGELLDASTWEIIAYQFDDMYLFHTYFADTLNETTFTINIDLVGVDTKGNELKDSQFCFELSMDDFERTMLDDHGEIHQE